MAYRKRSKGRKRRAVRSRGRRKGGRRRGRTLKIVIAGSAGASGRPSSPRRKLF